MKNIQSQHWSLKRKIMFPKNKTKTNEKNHTTNKKKEQKKKEQK